jgi:hypothetical protein
MTNTKCHAHRISNVHSCPFDLWSMKSILNCYNWVRKRLSFLGKLGNFMEMN